MNPILRVSNNLVAFFFTCKLFLLYEDACSADMVKLDDFTPYALAYTAKGRGFHPQQEHEHYVSFIFQPSWIYIFSLLSRHPLIKPPISTSYIPVAMPSTRLPEAWSSFSSSHSPSLDTSVHISRASLLVLGKP